MRVVGIEATGAGDRHSIFSAAPDQKCPKCGAATETLSAAYGCFDCQIEETIADFAEEVLGTTNPAPRA